MRMSQITKLRKYTKGENFSRFCERFQEYVYITKIEDRNLYMYFLQNVDDKTYSTLKSVKLTVSQKGNAELFCTFIKTLYTARSWIANSSLEKIFPTLSIGYVKKRI